MMLEPHGWFLSGTVGGILLMLMMRREHDITVGWLLVYLTFGTAFGLAAFMASMIMILGRVVNLALENLPDLFGKVLLKKKEPR